MKVRTNINTVELWLSANDTAEWAESWPCSAIAGKSLYAAWDSKGLYDFAVDSPALRIQAAKEVWIESSELNAITSDFLRGKLPEDHPCYFITVEQFVTD